MTQFATACYGLRLIPGRQCCRNKLRPRNNGSSLFTVPARVRGTEAVVQGRVGANSDISAPRHVDHCLGAAVPDPHDIFLSACWPLLDSKIQP